jgi:hypothetical protein
MPKNNPVNQAVRPLLEFWWTGVAGDFTARPIYYTGRRAIFHRMRRVRDFAFYGARCDIETQTATVGKS